MATFTKRNGQRGIRWEARVRKLNYPTNRNPPNSATLMPLCFGYPPLALDPTDPTAFDAATYLQ